MSMCLVHECAGFNIEEKADDLTEDYSFVDWALGNQFYFFPNLFHISPQTLF